MVDYLKGKLEKVRKSILVMARESEVMVAVVPYPGYGHINPLFSLGRLIASHDITVHFLSLADKNQVLKLRIKGDLKASNIHFHDLLPVSSSESQDAVTGEDGEVMFRKIGEPVSKICLQLSAKAKKLVIIHDNIMKYFVGDALSLANVESYMFHIGPGLIGYCRLKESVDGIIVDDDHEKLREHMQDEYPTLENAFGAQNSSYVRMEHEWKLNSGILVDSCRQVEGNYLDLYAAASDKPLWAVGPLNMMLESHESISTNQSRHECLEFLDKQVADSVIFVSFGTTTTFSQDQINEIALGLEGSKHRFIWVIRKAEDGDEIELGEGYEERVKGRGMVVRELVPQVEILRHPSTGGFLSHCGWNSCMESMSFGVPVGTWPFSYDQPYNAIYITQVLKIGVTVRSWARREELVTATSIEKAIKTLMGTPEGEEMRQRAVELSNKIKTSVSLGGPARNEMESFISHIIK